MADEEKLWQVNTCTHTHTHVHTDADLLVHNSKPNRSGSSGSTTLLQHSPELNTEHGSLFRGMMGFADRRPKRKSS